MSGDDAVMEDPDILDGEPCLRGTRMPVYMVAEMRRAEISIEEMLRSYPSLTSDLIDKACTYATTHPRNRSSDPIWRKTMPLETISIPKQKTES
jgi:uncharacterized protein (DUF433 family)